MSELSEWELEQKRQEELGLPRCQGCDVVLLDGKKEAWKEKGDVGDWISLELVCAGCAKDNLRSFERLTCQCTCGCADRAVTVFNGYLSCESCERDHTQTEEYSVEDPDDLEWG